MREMLENRPLFRKHAPHHRFAILLIAAPQNVMVRSGHIANAVQLHKSQHPYDLEDVSAPDRSLRETLQVQRKPARFAVGDPKGHALFGTAPCPNVNRGRVGS